MKKLFVVFVTFILASGMVALADTADEIRELILEDNEKVRTTLKGRPDSYSKDGALEFWSSGGLMHSVTNADDPGSYEVFTIRPKHIEVITLVEGKAAVAMYYSEGAMHPKGASPVGHYMTRVTAVYVNEGGQWKVRASHWSPILGGSGTSQTALD